MKQLAVVLAAILTFTLVAPVFAQPFADVPTDHWAYDAIAELAAKGLVEGYPDGAFRGDRALTRFEMAMVVARLLARIEAIKIPPLPPDLVRRPELTKSIAAAQAANAAARTAIDKRLTAKLATIQRLVAEFRAELAALGVRVTAVEEELAAIRARLDNTRVTGDHRTRLNVSPDSKDNARLRMRLTFTGRGGPNTEAVLRLWAANNANICPPGAPSTQCSAVNRYDTFYGNVYAYGNVSFDLAYVDVRNTYGASLWRVGRQFYTLAGHGAFGTGLLYDPAGSVAAGRFMCSTALDGAGCLTTIGVFPYGQTTTGVSDGLRADWTLGPLSVTTAVYVERTPTAATTGASGAPTIRDNWIVAATTGQFLPGWTLGGAFYRQSNNFTTPAGTLGGTGWEFWASGSLMPGVSLFADYASWTATLFGAPALAAATAWRVGGNINLAQVLGITMWNPNVDLAYQNFGPSPTACPFVAPSAAGCFPQNTYATTIVGQLFAWNMRGWLARLNLTFSPRTSAFVLYEGGNVLSVTSGPSNYTEWWVRLAHTVAPRTTVTLNFYRGTGPNSTPTSTATFTTFNFYRAEFLYSW